MCIFEILANLINICSGRAAGGQFLLLLTSESSASNQKTNILTDALSKADSSLREIYYIK